MEVSQQTPSMLRPNGVVNPSTSEVTPPEHAGTPTHKLLKSDRPYSWTAPVPIRRRCSVQTDPRQLQQGDAKSAGFQELVVPMSKRRTHKGQSLLDLIDTKSSTRDSVLSICIGQELETEGRGVGWRSCALLSSHQAISCT
jgi:hypothetical protein